MKLAEALRTFDTQLAADGRSPLTRANYLRHVRAFESWLVTHGLSDELDQIRTETLAAYLTSPEARDSVRGGPKRTSALNTIRTSLRVFFSWTHAAGLAPTNAARLIRRAITTPPPPRALTDLELRKLEDALILGRGPVARRDHALIAVLLHSGIRLGSAVALDRNDVDLDDCSLHLRKLKGDRSGRVFFGSALHDHLVGYLANKPCTGPLFRGPGGERVSKRQAGKRVSYWLALAGINATPHALRHTFGTRLLRKTGDLFLVQRAMLHKSVVSTTAYLSVSDDRLKAALQ